MESKIDVEIENNIYYRINWIYLARIVRSCAIEYYRIAYIFYITGRKKLGNKFKILMEKSKILRIKIKEECNYWWEEYTKWWNKTINKKE